MPENVNPFEKNDEPNIDVSMLKQYIALCDEVKAMSEQLETIKRVKADFELRLLPFFYESGMSKISLGGKTVYINTINTFKIKEGMEDPARLWLLREGYDSVAMPKIPQRSLTKVLRDDFTGNDGEALYPDDIFEKNDPVLRLNVKSS